MAGKPGKRGPIKRSEFGRLLSEHRRRSKDPLSGELLTQERLAELLEEIGGLPGYAYFDISRWEKGGAKGQVIAHDNRSLLVSLALILHRCGGINTLDEANRLLQAGFYSELDDNEIRRIDDNWITTNLTTPTRGEQGAIIEGQTYAYTHTPMTSPQRDNAPFMVPPLPPQGVVGRDGLLNKIFNQLQLSQELAEQVPPLALKGMGGIGKTTLTIALGRLGVIQTLFPDGILWTALGPNPVVRFLLEDWGRALGIDLLPERNEDTCRERLQEKLYHRRVLLIVDDVWEIAHGKHFMVAGPYSRTVLTTRESPVAYHLATRERTLQIDVLEADAALKLLHRLAPEAVSANKNVAQSLCARLEYLPLALTLAGRLLANEADVPSRMQRLLDELLEHRGSRLQLPQSEGRLGIDEDKPVSLQTILGLSVSRLSEIDRIRFAAVSVFGGEPLTWDLKAASHIWECSLPETEATLSQLIQRGLIVRQENGRYWMHALLADYGQQLMDEMGL